ncbi:cytosolic 5'-nucleotidase 3-like [Alosa alosa]|uniref:cytosolic 5'-nucleotidase 3-like n=1 Tax=Alosa alosa TaxID=278164 RepID=UPI002015491D|nr:cytosolic 5'-nucleotidase 3-like [Alosa alosa]
MSCWLSRESRGSFWQEQSANQEPSSGLGDVLLEILKHNNVLSSNLSIRANFMHFSEEGLLQGFKEPLIHTFNKGEGHLASPTHTAHDRPNVLLLGDSLGDVSMADNLTNVMNVLRIGFLNDKVSPVFCSRGKESGLLLLV